MNKYKIYSFGFLVLNLWFLVLSCNQGNNKITETTTRGEIKISVDESYQLMIDAQLDVFHSLYKYAKINVSYKPENEIFADFFNDSVRAIITNRKLTKEEEDALKSTLIIPRTTKIAYDAIAFIINNENPDTNITFNQIKGIFKGNIIKWTQLSANKKLELSDIKVVFDNNKSGNIRYINEKFSLNNVLPKYCYAVNSNEEVINFVERNKNAIGIISVNWISDPHDSLSLSFLKRIKVVGVSTELDPDGNTGNFYKPFQAYIFNRSYPFVREVYYISRETFAGLGTGFAGFLAGDQGQRIIRRAGLVPATMPIRLIQIK